MSKVADYEQEIRDAIEWLETERSDRFEYYPDMKQDELGRCYKALDLAITALRAQIEPGWIKVSDRLPDYESDKDRQTSYLVYYPNDQEVCYYRKNRFVDSYGETVDDVTHWMPLPEPPKDGE